MTRWILIRRSLCYYWRTNLGVMLGVAFCTAVLTGALIVGDTVRSTLRRMVLERLGQTQGALESPGRYFRSELAHEIGTDLAGKTAGYLQVAGMVTNAATQERLNRVMVYGVEPTFWNLALKASEPVLGDNDAVINEAVAHQLGLNAGDEIVVRVDKPGLLPREMLFAGGDDQTAARRLTARSVARPSQMGRFGLKNTQDAVYNLFVPIRTLQALTELDGLANGILVGDLDQGKAIGQANATLKHRIQGEDLGLSFRRVTDRMVQMQSNQVFLDDTAVEAARKISPSSQPLLAYFVNSIRGGAGNTPYSMVAGIESDTVKGVDPKANEIYITRWLADDLSVKTGDPVRLDYWVLTDTGALQETGREFIVAGIVEEIDLAAQAMMPDIPGLTDTGNCREWKSGIPIDFDRIRPKDEEYWDQYRGTPKAYIALKTAQEMWGNRWGRLTAIRFPSTTQVDEIAQAVIGRIDPAQLGLSFRDVRGPALAGAAGQTDFGQLFLGLSMFLILSALLLPALLFTLNIGGRHQQLAMLRIQGFSTRAIAGLVINEALVLITAGVTVGLLLAMGYAGIVARALNSNWISVTGTNEIEMGWSFGSLLMGGFSGGLLALASVWLAVRRDIKRRLLDLLWGRNGYRSVPRMGRRLSLIILGGATIGSMILLWLSGQPTTILFFAMGTVLLLAGIIGFRYYAIRPSTVSSPEHFNLSVLTARGIQRTPGRSLAVAIMMACGVFMVVAVGASHKNPGGEVGLRSSGTGGFALIARTAIPLRYDLDRPDAINLYQLDPELMRGVSIVSLRLHEGDNAGCLNLNKPVRPALVGVPVDDFLSINPFTMVVKLDDREQPWAILQSGQPDTVPAITDQSAILWSLGKKLGDTLEYENQRGGRFNLTLAGGLNNSILQGYLILSEDQFKQHFPDDTGYRVFLIDCPSDQTGPVASMLKRSLADTGVEVEPAVAVLSRLYAVENTYLAIFMQLGGLGLILGTVGMAIVVFRNVMERRNELALLQAVGYRRAALVALVTREHLLPFSCGLLLGVVAAGVAVAPGVLQGGGGVAWIWLASILVFITLSGILWVALATRLALRGTLVMALRSEQSNPAAPEPT